MALGKSVGWIEDNISSRELIEWMAFAQLEPFGDERADLRMGIETAALVRLWADPKKAKNITPATFMPFYEKPPTQPQTPEQLAAKFTALTSRFAA